MVEDSGFEPDSWDSKSQVQTNIPILNKLVGEVGFEPTTFRFQAEHADQAALLSDSKTRLACIH